MPDDRRRFEAPSTNRNRLNTHTIRKCLKMYDFAIDWIAGTDSFTNGRGHRNVIQDGMSGDTAVKTRPEVVHPSYLYS